MSDLQPLPSHDKRTGRRGPFRRLGTSGRHHSAAVIEPSATRAASSAPAKKACWRVWALRKAAFALSDERLQLDAHVADGESLAAGTDVMTITGPAIALLSAERVALNFWATCRALPNRATKRTCGAHTRAFATRAKHPVCAREKYAVRRGRWFQSSLRS